MIVGGYSLDLYCDNVDKHAILDNGSYYLKLEIGEWIPIKHQFSNETYSHCVKEAREFGWLVNRKENKCLCKYCR